MTDLSEYIGYNPESGAFTWLVSAGNRRAGSSAGSAHKNGYTVVNVDGKSMGAHRLAWLLFYGSIPGGMDIDHINGNRADNRLENLRCVSRSVNLQNRKQAASHNKIGLLGVSYHKGAKKFRASINVDGKSKDIGYFDNQHEAHAAYMAAKNRLHEGKEACQQAHLTILEQFIQRAA